jgi:serine/threonine protein kinase
LDIRPGVTLSGPNGVDVVIESELGRGGFGQVFLGRMPDDTKVAVKTVITATLNDDELKSLLNEAQFVSAIDHPNVVRVLHVNSGDDRAGLPPYLILEYVDGGNLRGFLDRHGTAGTKPSPEDLRGFFIQIAEGMQAVNAKAIHRDLKPENVLLDSRAGLLKIADFGLAKLADAATRSETFKGWGTRPYQAPEAYDAGPNTTAMDVYSAGVLFFELATLTWPVQPKPGDNSPIAWRNAHLLTPPADIRRIRPDLTIDLVQLIQLMLQKDAARRPSWTAVVERLRKGPTPTGGPDVSVLVQKATASLAAATERETLARKEREQAEERSALLQQAMLEPIAILQGLVDAFNEASDVGKLVLRQQSNWRADVSAASGGRARLSLESHEMGDLDTRQNGIFRIAAIARVEPVPTAANKDQFYQDRESFGSFNLAYRVRQSHDRFGSWTMLRFEHSPLVGRMSYPRWFAVELGELPHELQVLNAMGVYQHQEQSLGGDWFKLLLAHLV